MKKENKIRLMFSIIFLIGGIGFLKQDTAQMNLFGVGLLFFSVYALSKIGGRRPPPNF